jgi:GNAT superfamily N-acetyltransferase
MLNFELLTWEQVKPIWDTALWPGRDSEPASAMKYLDGYDMALKEIPPFFIGLIIDDEIIAVNSYTSTAGTSWRSRGLWVRADRRGNGYGTEILKATKENIKLMGGSFVWTMPRREALSVYKAAGFIRTTGWSTHDWGENCYAISSLSDIWHIGRESLDITDRRIDFYNTVLCDKLSTGISLDEARRAMKPLADMEEEEWR